MPRVSYAAGLSIPNNEFVAVDSVVELTMRGRGAAVSAKTRRCIPGSMVKEGYSFGLPPLVLGGAFFLLHWYIAAGLLVFLALFVFSFFRDPERVIPAEPGAVVSPADGRVMVVKEEENAGRPGKRISIFLAIWNVHINRSPATGTITKLEYRPGKFLAAMKERASVENEQNVFTLSTDAGEMVFKQIAGLIARRVVSWKKQGDKVARGERIGLMRFSSRMDLWVPKEAEIVAKVGDRVEGGTSILARWPVKAAEEPTERPSATGTDANLTATGKRL
ncbi:MAG TPA: phosphatidylserine decarboxylase [Candidatus Acidoferrum sp.]|nr:phosphatidylserine decarboxylase [Candidatus Acidoferrum sp.]